MAGRTARTNDFKREGFKIGFHQGFQASGTSKSSPVRTARPGSAAQRRQGTPARRQTSTGQGALTMFTPSRDDVRDFFSGVWKKHDAREIMTPLETQALDWVLEHPQYHPLLAAPEQYRDKDFLPEFGEVNPFLHLSLHLSVTEQISIDQPPGIRAQFERLAKKHGSLHEAAHDVLECLGETVWKAQRDNAPPDGEAYLECIKRK